MIKELEKLKGVNIIYDLNFIVAKGNSWAVKMILREYGYQDGYDYEEIAKDEIAIYL